LGANVEAFRDELRDLGYVEGTNIVIEYRSADGKPDRVPRLVTELVQLKVDVLISGDDPTIRVFKQATKTIPIVMVIRTQLRQDLSTAWLARAEISRRLADSLGN
jgi:putative tryptophan/tyrosine transport system substrate-binding protein